MSVMSAPMSDRRPFTSAQSTYFSAHSLQVCFGFAGAMTYRWPV